MYRNGIKTKVVLKKRALRKEFEAGKNKIRSMYENSNIGTLSIWM